MTANLITRQRPKVICIIHLLQDVERSLAEELGEHNDPPPTFLIHYRLLPGVKKSWRHLDDESAKNPLYVRNSDVFDPVALAAKLPHLRELQELIRAFFHIHRAVTSLDLDKLPVLALLFGVAELRNYLGMIK